MAVTEVQKQLLRVVRAHADSQWYKRISEAMALHGCRTGILCQPIKDGADSYLLSVYTGTPAEMRVLCDNTLGGAMAEAPRLAAVADIAMQRLYEFLEEHGSDGCRPEGPR